MKHRLYLASPTEHRERTHAVGVALAATLGHAEVVSTWHRSEKAKYPLSHQERADALARNLSELERATAAVFLMDFGRPLTTLGELGYALGRGIPVVMTKPEYSWQRSLFDAHASVTVVPAWRLDSEDLVCRLAWAIEGWSIDAARNHPAAEVGSWAK